MCLIFFSVNNHPKYKLILAGNRDEFYNRKTSAADFWKDQPNILGGRDLEAGGTWMGITRKGKISFITNYRDPLNINSAAPSRGHLVSDYLENDKSPSSYIKEVESKAKLYNGFNLVVGDVDSLWYFSNYGPSPLKIDSGYYGLSNHLLETPWPKVIHGKEKLKPFLNASVINNNDLFTALYDSERAADDRLPNTGIGLERERALSSIFIKSPDYGSRCSTIILVDHSNHVIFSERIYDLETFEHSTQNFEFDIV
jgi:uncharacterized protein with NRDE domain